MKPPHARPKAARSGLSGLLVAVAIGLCGCRSAELTAPRHLFLITVDTLRADHLAAYGYPRATSPTFDALAPHGVLFERAIAQWPKTGPSFASLFTGRYPQTTGLTHEAAIALPAGYLTLAELLRSVGMTTLAVVSNPVLGDHLGWDRGFEEYRETWELGPEVSRDPVVYRRWLNGARVNEVAAPLLRDHRGAERLFVWIHYSDPHAPYLLPDGEENPFLGDERYVGSEEVVLERPAAMALGQRRDLKHYVAQYDANVLYAERRIGDLLGYARTLGLLDDALVVLTADHGESLGDHGYYFDHGRLPHNAGSHVPLLFYFQPVRFGGRRVEVPVELIDLLPSLRDLFAPDQEVPGLEGESLWPLVQRPLELDDDGPRYAFSEAGGGSPLTHFRNVQDRRWKLVFHPAFGPPEAPRPERWELFDLQQDPRETSEAGHRNPRELRRLQRALSGWMRGAEWIRRPRSEIRERSEETLRALQALGYVE